MKVITFAPHEIENELTRLISEIDFQPDLVVGILNGAKFMVETFQKSNKFNDSIFCEVKLQRNTEKMKRSKWIAFFLKKMPYVFLNQLRKLESIKVKAKIRKIDFSAIDLATVDLTHFPNSPLKKILIIDDALDSGKTIYVVKKQLQQKYPSAEIRAAVITWTIEQSIIHPDYCLYKKVLIRYPWSKDFKH